MIHKYLFSKVQQTFIHSNKFNNGLYAIYQSTEGRSIKVLNGIYLTMFGISLYEYYKSSLETFNEGLRENSFLFMQVLGAGMIFFNIKVARTVKTIYLDVNGRYSYIEMYRKLGFSNNIVQIENIHFKGIGYFLHKSIRIPQIRVVDPATNNVMRLFFKQKYILDELILKELLLGKNFSIANEQMQIHMSEKKKKKFNL